MLSYCFLCIFLYFYFVVHIVVHIVVEEMGIIVVLVIVEEGGDLEPEAEVCCPCRASSCFLLFRPSDSPLPL